jgi:hypothetical protein
MNSGKGRQNTQSVESSQDTWAEIRKNVMPKIRDARFSTRSTAQASTLPASVSHASK